VASSRKRRLFVVSLLLAAFLAVALGHFPQEALRGLIESRLQKALGPQARIGQLHFVPAFLTLEVGDLSFESPALGLRVPRARAALMPASLLSGAVALRFLEMDSPTLRIRPTGGSRSAVSVSPISALSVDIRKALFVYEDPTLGGEVRLSGLDLHGSLGAGSLEITSTGGAFAGGKPLGPTRARLRISPTLNLVIESLEFGTARSRIVARGDLGPALRPRPRLSFEGHVDLEDASLVGAGPATGLVFLKGGISGESSRLLAEGTLRGEELSIRGWPLTKLDARAHYDGAGRGETTLEAGAALLGGSAQAHARFLGNEGEGRIKLQGIDIKRLAKFGGPADLSGTLSGEVGLKGDMRSTLQTDASFSSQARLAATTVSGVLEARGTLHVRDSSVDLSWTVRLDGRGTSSSAPRFVSARLEGSGTAVGPMPPALEGAVAGDLLLEASEPVDLPFRGQLSLRGSRSKLALESSALGGSLSLSSLAEGALLERVLVKGESLDLTGLIGGAQGRAFLALDASGPVSRASGSASLRLEDLVLRTVPMGGLNLELQSKQGKGSFALQMPALDAVGRGEFAIGTPRLHGSLTLHDTSIATLAALASQNPGTSGRVSLRCDLDVPLSDPRALNAQAQIQSLSIERDRWRLGLTKPVALEAHGRRLIIEDLGVEGSGLGLGLKGSVGFDPKQPLDLHVRANVDLAQLPLSERVKLEGAGEADVTVTGPRGHPQIHGTLTGQKLGIEAESLPRISLPGARLDLEGDTIHVPGITARLAEGSVSLSGRVPLAALLPTSRVDPARIAPAESAHLNIEWQGIQAKRLLERLSSASLASLEASLAGAADIDGGGASLAELNVEVRVPATPLVIDEQPFEISPLVVTLRKGEIAAKDLVLSGEGGRFVMAGQVDLLHRTLAGAGKGRVDLRALSPLVGEASLTGVADVDLSVGGTIEAPRPLGSIRLSNGGVRLRAIPEALTSLNASVLFEGTQARLEEASGALGGGALTGSGSATLTGAGLSDVALSFKGRDVALRYPAGLRSRVDAELALKGRTGALLLEGTVRAQRGLYDLDVAVESSLFTPVVKPVDSPFLRSIGLDVQVDVDKPVLVRNNLARIETTGSLTARGDMQNPEPFGRLEIGPGGKIYIQDREFVVKTGSLVYEGSWNPVIALEAETSRPVQETTGDRGTFRITLLAQGSLEAPEIHLRSDPPRPEAEVVSLLATGQTEGDPLNSGRWIAGQEAATLLAARLTRGVRRGLQSLGIDEVTIQPELLAKETEPGARFTFGKRLTPWVDLLYSQSLTNADERFEQLEAQPIRDFTLTGQRRDDGTFTYGVGQRLKFLGPSRAGLSSHDEKTILKDVRFEGDPSPLRATHVHAGGKVSPWDLQDEADRLRGQLIRQGYLEAEVGARVEGDSAIFRVRLGPRFLWRVEGMVAPPDLTAEIQTALYEEEALDRGREKLLKVLRNRGHIRARVDVKAVDEAEARVLVFRTEPGPPLHSTVVFTGAKALGGKLLEISGGSPELLVSTEEALKRIREAYRERHYLCAEVKAPIVEQAHSTVKITVPVLEGSPARIASVRFEGTTLDKEELLRVAGVEEGALYDETAMAGALQRLREHYLTLGYPTSRIMPSPIVEGCNIAGVFRVIEGQRVVVGSVTITGNTRTSPSLIRRQVELKTGDPLDPRKLAQAERRLRNLGVFSRVSVTATPESPAIIRIDVEEDAILTAAYDVRYNDTEKWGGLADGGISNLFGWAVAVGGRYRAARDLREARSVMHVPSLGRAGDLTLSLFETNQTLSAPPGAETIQSVVKGIDMQQTARLPNRWDILYGYRFKSIVVTSFTPVHIGGITLSLARDTRDSPLDARRGGFLSLNLELFSSFLGSDSGFIRGFGQAFLNHSFSESLSWAQGYRLGLARGFQGDTVLSTERFRAGGANSLRGFASDSVGPRDFLGFPQGGEATLVVNQELRFRHRSGLGLVLFYDVGNVFSTLSDFKLDLRHSLGTGFRYASPVGLLRLDLGFPLARGANEKAYQVFFSLGQAF